MLIGPSGPCLRRVACVLVSVALTVLVANTDAAQPRIKRNGVDVKRLRMSPLRHSNREIQVFVRLDEPAVAELNAGSVERSGTLAPPEQQKAQAQRVSAQQASFRQALQARGARILSAQRVGANGLRVLVRSSELANLRALPGVRSVGRVEIHKPDNVESVPWIGAPAVWTKVGKGEGVKIGIIDTGIDYTHATFGGSGNPADYQANSPLIVEPGTFPVPGGAVRGGIDLAGANYDAGEPASVPVPDADPLDGDGHGTHVAATAAGRGVAGSVGSGVAPGAELYAIKVFGDTAGSTDLTSAGIEWALDPNGDGDMSDRMDVINMSLGSPLGYPDDPSAISAENASKLGIIVVASAGNEGTIPYITGAPAVAPAAISVAATLPGGRVYARFAVTAPAAVSGIYPSVEGAGPVTFKQLGSVSGALATATPADGCAPLTNDSAGKIAFIVRGACDFVVKYRNAQAAGAKAIVVYNDGATPERRDPIAMGGLDNTISIPGLMVSFDTGNKLKDAAGVQITIDLGTDPARNDAVASFSSLGPGSGGSSFKPDLSAPGEAILSAGVGSGTGAANLSGTSMAAPHIAGAAALLKQKHPLLDPSAIKAILQNSTTGANASVDTRLTRQGTGVVRIDRAVALTSFAKPGGLSFGRLNPLLPIFRTEKITVMNLERRSRTFTGRHVANRSVAGVKVLCPSVVSVGPGQRAKAEILLKFDPVASARQNVGDDGLTSQREVDGWCVLSDGKDQLRVGYVATVDPAASVIVTAGPKSRNVTVRNLGPAVGLAEGFTLAKLGGESSDDAEQSIAAVGFRRADPNLYGAQVLELGIATEAAFNHLSALSFSMQIDVNKDGVSDYELVGQDVSTLDLDEAEDAQPGTFVTAQFDAAGGFLDWVVNTWDFNDRTFILPFTLTADGGFAPEKFDYVLTLEGHDGSVDTQRGSIDLAREIVPDLNSFSIAAGETVRVQMSRGKGLSLWLLQNNPLFGQMGITAIQ